MTRSSSGSAPSRSCPPSCAARWADPSRRSGAAATRVSTRHTPARRSRGPGPTAAGDEVHGLHFAPTHPEATGPEGELPPLLVFVHGGPTSRTEAGLQLARAFWTTRGFAVLDVNHSGSTGHGRAYRDRLLGQWGVIDIDDVVTGARSLATAGRVDGDRLAIRGGSAGGYTVLRALTTSDTFAAGTSYFGVADLEALATDTHKFESRYLDRLVGPYPQERDTYVDRSPLHHVDPVQGAVLLLQGGIDEVVPPGQAEAMAAGMRAAGEEVELVIYPGRGPRLPRGLGDRGLTDARARLLRAGPRLHPRPRLRRRAPTTNAVAEGARPPYL